MWDRVTYLAVPFGGAGRFKSLRVLSEPKEGEAMPQIDGLHVCMYVCMYAYENISIYMYVCMHACMYVDAFQPVELSRHSILGLA